MNLFTFLYVYIVKILITFYNSSKLLKLIDKLDLILKNISLIVG